MLPDFFCKFAVRPDCKTAALQLATGKIISQVLVLQDGEGNKKLFASVSQHLMYEDKFRNKTLNLYLTP